jgi:AcrR family transcriptional regulator
MASGKLGRPREDRLARQREIFGAIAPLILRDGARRLSMRQAASAAGLSLGGLYHYFPTKRDLVLHGLCPEAILRRCQDFHSQHDHLVLRDPRRYLDEGIQVVVEHVEFCRPALSAALELGADQFWTVVETLLASTALTFEESLARLYPQASPDDVKRWGLAIRHSVCAALLDKSVSPDQLRDELRVLVRGYRRRVEGAGRTPASAPIATRG